MKVHHHQQQFPRGIYNYADHQETTCLSLGCKRLRPLAPKLPGNDVVSTTTTTAAAFDLKSFIRPDCGPRKLAPVPPSDLKNDPPQVETHHGGTRWNPTQEQIGILEALYCRGMRTPNAQQIEQITAQLSKYGKIEGKNVFYWFQNHKARERQKQKRNCNPQTASFLSTTTSSITFSFDSTKEEYWKREEQVTPLSKRKCRSWTFESLIHEINTNNKSDNYSNNFTERDEEDGVKKITLDLFPLHPETR